MTSYRAYKKGTSRTFFEEDVDGWFCTHGAWHGDHIVVDGKPALKHARGVSVYESYQDLTEQEYMTLSVKEGII